MKFFRWKIPFIFWRWEYCRRGNIGRAYLHFSFKKYNILLPLSSHAPAGGSRTLIFLWGGTQALVACKPGRCGSRAESQCLELGAEELLSNAHQRQRPPQPGEAARGNELSKWDLLFKYFLQCTDSWKRGQQAEWKQRNCGGGMRNRGRVSRLWVSKDPRKNKRVKLEKENYRMQEGVWLKYTADILNWSC